MKKILILSSLLMLLSLGFAISADYTGSYPVAELGNCANQRACEAYCDITDNIETCLNFAEKNNLISQEELAEARKFLPYLISGTTPGNCKNQKACEAYCNDEANLNGCIDFAVKAGLIDAKEAEMVKKTGGKGPGGCKKEECKTYCEDETHIDECIDFAVQNGLMPASEAEMAKKTKGKGPGNCKGKEECDAFCNNEANFATCVDFAVQYGMMDAKDAEMVKKTGGKGPGGCKSKEECDAFCKNPDNRETCDNFAIENGIVSQQEAENMKKNQEFMNSAEGKCIDQCYKEKGIGYDVCTENGQGPEACKECADKCFPHNDGNCLSQEKWQQLDSECKAKGSGYHLEEVKGDDGRGGVCVINENCVYSSDQMWESQEEKDRKMTEMEEQWAREREEYESAHSPGGSENQGEYTGGCTQPGPNGECNPGPGAGDYQPPREEATQVPQTEQVQQQPSSTPDSGGSMTPGDAAPTSGGEAPVTGSVIAETSRNLISRFVEIVKSWFS